MFCCTSSFSYLNDEPTNALSSPRGCRKKHSTRNKNRFSTTGLDKFSKVMTELQAKREQILVKAESPASVVVLFMYSNSCDWIPIIVRLPNPPAKKSRTEKLKLSPPPTPLLPKRETHDVAGRAEKVRDGKLNRSFSLAVKERGKESLYWGVVMMVILVCLLMFSRNFAICCTTIWWYRVPIMMGGDNELKMKSTKKKDYTRPVNSKRLGRGAASSSLIRKSELGSPWSHANAKTG